MLTNTWCAGTIPPDTYVKEAVCNSNHVSSATKVDSSDCINRSWNKPASEIQQHVLSTLQSLEMVAVIANLHANPIAQNEIDGQQAFTAAMNAALATGLKNQKRQKEGGFGAGAPEMCVQACINIKT